MSYVLTSGAEADLRGIIRHTRKEWGAAQARGYVAKLEAGFVRIATGQGVYKELNDIYPALRMARVHAFKPGKKAFFPFDGFASMGEKKPA